MSIIIFRDVTYIK